MQRYNFFPKQQNKSADGMPLATSRHTKIILCSSIVLLLFFYRSSMDDRRTIEEQKANNRETGLSIGKPATFFGHVK